MDIYGRFKVYAPDHHRSGKHGYVFRSIIACELYNNITIPTTMAVHHKDENRLNDSKENLEVMIFGKHTTLHQRDLSSDIKRICEVCKKEFIIKRWRLKDPTRGKFCSVYCRGKRIVSQETRRKRSESLKKAHARRMNKI